MARRNTTIPVDKINGDVAFQPKTGRHSRAKVRKPSKAIARKSESREAVTVTISSTKEQIRAKVGLTVMLEAGPRVMTIVIDVPEITATEKGVVGREAQPINGDRRLAKHIRTALKNVANFVTVRLKRPLKAAEKEFGKQLGKVLFWMFVLWIVTHYVTIYVTPI